MRVEALYIEVTNRCNLNCATCYNRSGLNRETRELSVSELEDILSVFSAYGLKRVIISGGEPTLHSDFEGILAMFDRHPDILFGVVTNGTTGSRALAEYVRRDGRFTLQISLDGSCEEVNAKTRGEGNFARAIEFARQFKDAGGKKLLKMVVSQNNCGDVESFYGLAVECGFTPEFAFVFRSGNGETDWEQKSVSGLQQMKTTKLIDRLNRKYKVNATLPQCTNRCPFTGDDPDGISLCIKPDGAIQPCQSLYDGAYSVGNACAFDAGAFERGMKRITELARARAERDYGCGTCMLRDGCGRGCMAEAVCLHGDPLANDGNCGFRKAFFIEAHVLGNIGKS